jgi:hypothetical protein
MRDKGSNMSAGKKFIADARPVWPPPLPFPTRLSSKCAMPWMQAQFSIAVLSDVKVLRRLFDRTDRPDPDRDLKNALWTRLDTKFS